MSERQVEWDACWWDRDGLNIEWISKDNKKRMWLCLGTEPVNNFYGWLIKDERGVMATQTEHEMDWENIRAKHDELFGKDE